MAKLLIVEDEVIIGETIKMHLEAAGHEVIEHFISGEEVIEYISEPKKANPELILFDINLAGKLSGIDTAEIVSHSFNIPFIYLTGNGDLKNITKAKDTFPFGYILKPYDEKILELTVEMALNLHQNLTKASEMKEAIKEQNRLAELGESFGGLCHDLVSPIGVIHERSSLLINNLKNGDISPEMTIEKLNKILSSAEHCLTMVKSCKHWINSQNHEPYIQCNLYQIAKEVAELTKNKLVQTNVNFIIGDELRNFVFPCQKVKFLNVLTNLINNASDAVKHLDNREITLECEEQDGKIFISIIDSGKGIPEELQDKIFKPLFTTKDANSGTGLGLSISQKIIRAQNGELYLDTDYPNTKFVITLPKDPEHES